MKCPECNKGTIHKIIVEEYNAKLKGISFPVKNAEIGKCDACDAELYSAKEIRRWERALDDYLISSGLILKPKQISDIREKLGLSAIEFAKLLGVTRQSVYGWENDKSKPLSIGPTSLLLSFLFEEQKKGISGVIDFLIKSANDRGIEIQIETPNIPFPSKLKNVSSGCPGFSKELCVK